MMGVDNMKINKTKTIITFVLLSVYGIAMALAGYGLGINDENLILETVNKDVSKIPGADCKDYTMEAKKRLDKAGIESYPVITYNNKTGSGHAFIKVCRDYDISKGVVPVSDDYVKRDVFCQDSMDMNNLTQHQLATDLHYCKIELEICNLKDKLKELV